MGYSISERTARTLDKRRRDGELCAGPARNCTTRATVELTQETWTHKLGEGPSHVSTLRMCPRHAREFPAGYAGVNFTVLAVRQAAP